MEETEKGWYITLIHKVRGAGGRGPGGGATGGSGAGIIGEVLASFYGIKWGQCVHSPEDEMGRWLKAPRGTCLRPVIQKFA